ncbi:hypothetical protein DI53_3413 [Sphingobacterium deserti]|uniref:YtkA-like domain-containing protein n=2 Tax=Sphingobacterium deserti TaxID=1229276 RepID=A0A0B8T5E9_9SPHI|nr:hypothetical protein DI53_3413 [Sphingobacterium deserti]
MLVLGLLIASCTKDKTDYEAERDDSVVEHVDFKEAATIDSNGYSIRIEALNGTFYKGYNPIRLKVTGGGANGNANVSAATFLPIKLSSTGSETSCPHQHHLSYQPEDAYFSGYCVFTEATTNAGVWELQISFAIDGKMITARQAISVQPQTNKNLNMTTFTGSDNEQYIIALIAPQKPTVSENELLAGIYKFNKASEPTDNPLAAAYVPVTGYTLQLDPRMPEPSMGNHSSPNNKDLVQDAAGHYRGVVNYTMTGNWTLNFIMQNNNGQIVKGTVVPDDFTPGVMGVKSELHIDILF